ncbi:MAG: tRNA (adenosine(37)-N6)-threonylcarbamoyltransferase complex transferase subunit TsaD [Patescibacteria group bacterium]
MKLLAIETSCDETGISILSQADHITLGGNALASQIALHAQYGGVFPAMAKRAHAEKIVPLIKEALGQAGLLIEENSTLGTVSLDHIKSICTHEAELVTQLEVFFNTYKKPELDYIAVTVGPGLEPALWVGINTAKVLATVWNIPVIPVNHMEGHVVTAAIERLDDNTFAFKDLPFPLLALLVSGGHTELVLTKHFGDYQKIGQTRDDAVGEAFDKVARMLGLPYPGGPAVSKLAKEFRALNTPNTFELPRPMLHSQDYDFSFSGLKTAMLYMIRDLTEQNTREIADEEKITLAAAFEDAAIEVLIKKTLRAADEFHTQTIVVGGGVAGNGFLRDQLIALIAKKLPGVSVLFPEPWLATDNAVMIGLAACARVLNGSMQTQDALTLKANGNLSLDK